MDFKIPPRVAPILETIESFYEAEVRPLEEALRDRLADRSASLAEDGRRHPEIWQARREIMRASAQAGLYSLHLPESIGGGGLSRTEMLFVEEKVYGYGVGLNPAILAWTDGVTPRLIYCTEAQRARFVDPLVRGEATSLHAITEPTAGSSFFDLKTTAVRDGDHWILIVLMAYITIVFESVIAHVFALTDSG